MKATGISLAGLSVWLQAGEITSRELTGQYLQTIAQQEEALGAYLTVTAEQAMAEAELIDARRAAGEALHPLAGIPMALKDNLCTQGSQPAWPIMPWCSRPSPERMPAMPPALPARSGISPACWAGK